MGSLQKRAIKNYQSRRSETSGAHFQVLGLTADGDLIRSFAHQGDPRDAQRIAPRCASRPLSLSGDLSVAARSACAQ
jgi:hypothetical protein